jgi:putative ABC transport system permease protein
VSHIRPPRITSWLLRRFGPAGETGRSIAGDLLEELREAGGSRAARRHYRRHVASIVLRYGASREHAADVQLAHHLQPERSRAVFHALRQDVTFGLRAFLKRPAFALVIVATLALGIGAATAIFSIVDGVLLRPLPFDEPDRLVFANETTRTGRMGFAYLNYVDYRDRAQSFESLACHQANAFTIVGLTKPQRVDGRLVCWKFFDVLRVQPQLGRSFRAEDDRAGAAPVTIVSDRFWKQELAGDPNVLGRVLKMTEMTFTIVGVMPPGFQLTRREDIFVPIGLVVTPDSGYLHRGNHSGLLAVGRLKPGVDVKTAHAEAERIGAELAREHPATNSGNGAAVELLRDRIVETVRETLTVLMAAVGFLLLLACANVANLLVARGAARQHELAIRSAVGGSRWRLVRQLLVESSLLAGVGGVLGLALAFIFLRVLIAYAPADLPRLDQVTLSRTSLLFAFGATTLCGLVFGAFPALQTSSGRGQHLLARASRTSDAVSPRRTRRALMVVEVALALILVAACGLMARTMMKLHAVDPGFHVDRLFTARIALMGAAWTEPRRAAFFVTLYERLQSIPGVERAALTQSLPIEGSQWGSIFVVGDKPAPPRADLPASAFIPASAGYFETMGIRLVKGRTFDARDTVNSARVTVINETFARRLWPGEDAIGKRVKQGWPETPPSESPWREVVGVVADVKLEGVDQETPMQAFLPMLHVTPRTMAIVARTKVEPLTVVSAMEAAVQGLDKDTPLTRVRSMAELMSSAIARQLLSTIVLGVFAGVAILLSAIGLYGIVSHNVTERTREIGVRMALGAERRQVLRQFVGQGVLLASLGTAIGLAGAVAASRYIESLLFNVEPSDPATLVAVASLLLFVSLIACYIPARRAARIDPLTALRMD